MMIINTPASSVNNTKHLFNNNTSATHEGKAATNNDVAWDVKIPEHANDASTHKHHSEEDGKHHQFHLERVRNIRRGKKLCCFISHFIIAIMHISLLLCLFQHSLQTLFH